jgi:branched-chain amino acid transport system permease protein
MTTEALAGRAITMKAEARKRRATAILIVVGAGLLAVLPFVGVPRFTITLLTEALIFAIWAMSLDLMTGYTGMLTFGHAAASVSEAMLRATSRARSPPTSSLRS